MPGDLARDKNYRTENDHLNFRGKIQIQSGVNEQGGGFALDLNNN